jgi:hypothetical protein
MHWAAHPPKFEISSPASVSFSNPSFSRHKAWLVKMSRHVLCRPVLHLLPCQEFPCRGIPAMESFQIFWPHGHMVGVNHSVYQKWVWFWLHLSFCCGRIATIKHFYCEQRAVLDQRGNCHQILWFNNIPVPHNRACITSIIDTLHYAGHDGAQRFHTGFKLKITRNMFHLSSKTFLWGCAYTGSFMEKDQLIALPCDHSGLYHRLRIRV